MRKAICRCDPTTRKTETDGIVGVPTDQSFEFCVACGNAVDLDTCIIQMRASSKAERLENANRAMMGVASSFGW